MGILSVAHFRGGQRNIWWFEAFCLQFSGTEGPPKGPQRYPMVLIGQTSVPWEVKVKYCTMGWFHYGNTEHYSLERWTKGYLMIWGVLFAIFRHWGPPKGPRGSPMVLNGKTSVPWELRSQDNKFYYGMISLWDYWVLLTWEVDKGIFDDLRNFFATFRQWRAP